MLEAKFQGVLASGMGQFIHEALHRKAIVGTAHRAPESDRDRIFEPDPVHRDIGDLVLQAGQAGGGLCIYG